MLFFILLLNRRLVVDPVLHREFYSVIANLECVGVFVNHINVAVNVLK